MPKLSLDNKLSCKYTTGNNDENALELIIHASEETMKNFMKDLPVKKENRFKGIPFYVTLQNLEEEIKPLYYYW